MLCRLGSTIPRRGLWEGSPFQHASISCQHSSSKVGNRSGRAPADDMDTSEPSESERPGTHADRLLRLITCEVMNPPVCIETTVTDHQANWTWIQEKYFELLLLALHRHGHNLSSGDNYSRHVTFHFERKQVFFLPPWWIKKQRKVLMNLVDDTGRTISTRLTNFLPCSIFNISRIYSAVQSRLLKHIFAKTLQFKTLHWCWWVARLPLSLISDLCMWRVIYIYSFCG